MSLQMLEKHPPIVHSQMQIAGPKDRLAERVVDEYVKEHIHSILFLY